MKTIYPFILLLLVSLITASCERVIELDDQKAIDAVVVEGVISSEMDSSYVLLTRTLGFFDNISPIPRVVDAVVSVNGVSFAHVGNGIYKPASPYLGMPGTTYNLSIEHEGKTYTATSTLHAGVPVDTAFAVFKPQEGFIEEGYTVGYFAFDNRPRVKYTYFRFGLSNDSTQGHDSIFEFRVLFDNKDFPADQPYYFELPFLRLKKGDTCVMVFRSVDENVYRFLEALGNRGGSAFFGSPPANLPSNIRGGAQGIFAAYDVLRYRVPIPVE
jgi:hypothetical protein